jgi:hypothetical protein
MRLHTLISVVTAILYTLPMTSHGQSIPRINLFPSPTQTVVLSPLSATTVPAFANFRLGQNLDKAFVVLSNDSSEPIAGISARWVFISSTGKQRATNQWCDSFLSPYRPVMLAHSSLLLGPSSSIQDTAALSAGAVWSSERETSGLLADAAEVQIQVNGILFESGAYFGSATAHVEDINARVTVAKDIVAYVRSSQSKGESSSSILAGLRSLAQNRMGRSAKWFQSFVATLSNQPPTLFEPYVRSLEGIRLPAPIVIQKQ